MSFISKTWLDRISEYPNRRVLTKADNSTEIVTVARSEGTISKEGDAFSAANMNALETRIANAFTALKTVTEITLPTTGWTTITTGQYSIQLTLPGAVANINPDWTIKTAANFPSAAEITDLGNVVKMVYGIGIVTVYATAIPTEARILQFKGV
jgi:hypothetical protein